MASLPERLQDDSNKGGVGPPEDLEDGGSPEHTAVSAASDDVV